MYVSIYYILSSAEWNAITCICINILSSAEWNVVAGFVYMHAAGWLVRQLRFKVYTCCIYGCVCSLLWVPLPHNGKLSTTVQSLAIRINLCMGHFQGLIIKFSPTRSGSMGNSSYIMNTFGHTCTNLYMYACTHIYWP